MEFQRHANRLTTAAQKSKEGKETAKDVDAKLDKVFDQIEEAEEKISAGNIEQDTAMEERQKDPQFAVAKDALDLQEKELAPAPNQKQGEAHTHAQMHSHCAISQPLQRLAC